MEATLVCDSKSILGEGPVWHQHLQKLFWVDIEGKKINCYDPRDDSVTTHTFNQMPGALAPIDNEQFLVAFEDGIAVYNWTTKKSTYQNYLWKGHEKIRANDGKCDPNGNFWIGTMHLELQPKAGNLYRINPDYSSEIQIKECTISNGLAWASDKQTMYYIDTFDNCVYAYNFDVDTNEISQKRIVITIDQKLGGPDGMCIDKDDTLWIAHWGGRCVRQWDTHTGSILNEIELPAPHVTSCTFGGANLDELYITTASTGLSDQQLSDYPLSGGLFKVKTGTTGLATSFFNIHG